MKRKIVKEIVGILKSLVSLYGDCYTIADGRAYILAVSFSEKDTKVPAKFRLSNCDLRNTKFDDDAPSRWALIEEIAKKGSICHEYYDEDELARDDIRSDLYLCPRKMLLDIEEVFEELSTNDKVLCLIKVGSLLDQLCGEGSYKELRKEYVITFEGIHTVSEYIDLVWDEVLRYRKESGIG